MIEQGRHEELLTFLNRVNGSGYTLPTEYILCMWRSGPIQYAQSHFFTGPDWLAEEKYTSYYTTLFQRGEQHQCLGDLAGAGREGDDDVLKTLADLFQSGQPHDTGIKAYEWCRKFEASHPQEMKVYYEDENFCCYMIRQNTYRLYQLEES